jgi:outer membrane protein assembly factor BamB
MNRILVRFVWLLALPVWTSSGSGLGAESGSALVAEEFERAASRRVSPTDASRDWPHWRGPNRNGTVAEDSGWEAGIWPPRTPLWKANVGEGGTSPVVVGGRVYVLGWADGRDTLRCLDAVNGREVWRGSYAAPKYGRHATGDEGLYAGVTATPEYDPASGLLYTLGLDGHLACWSVRDRKEAWSLNLYDVYGAGRRDKIGRSGRRDYGYTASPLVHGDWLIVEVGAARGTVIALDKRTGREVWASRAAHQAGHSGGLVPITVEGIPCVAAFALKYLLVIRLDRGHEGETLEEYPWETEFAQNITTPAVWQNRVLITSGYNHQSACLLEITRQGARKVWEQPSYSQVCSPVIHAGRIYWVYQSPVCVDLETGRKIWEGPRRFGDAGSCVVTSDERLIFWTGRGDLVLAETAARSPGEYRELARTRTLFAADVWPHVTLAGGRVFCKDRDGNMVCFALTRTAAEAPPKLAGSTPPRPLQGTGPQPATPQPAAPPTAAAPGPPLDLASQLRTWPGTAPHLVVAWQRDGDANRLISRVAAATDAWRLKPRGAARFDARGTACLEGGAILVEGPEATLLDACRQSGELTVELRFVTERVPQSGPARILSFSQDGFQRNWTLAQEGDQLLFRLRTPHSGENGMNPETKLFSVLAGQPTYLVLSYRDGELTVYRDGKREPVQAAVRGDFRNWVPQHLLLGDEYADPRPWLGKIERFAVHSRAMDEGEVLQRDRLVRAAADARAKKPGFFEKPGF